MKLTVETKKLKLALHTLAAIPGKTGPFAVQIEAIEFEGLILRCRTHLASITVPCEAEIEESGIAHVALDPLIALCARLPFASLEIHSDNSKLNFKAGTSRTSLVLWPEKEFPEEIGEVTGSAFAFEAQQLAKYLNIAESASFKAAGREELRGVTLRTIFDRIALVGTDGRRMAALFGEGAMEPVLMSTLENRKGIDTGILLGKEITNCFDRLIGTSSSEAKIKVCPQRAEFSIDGKTMRFAINTEGIGDLWPFLKPMEPEITCLVNRASLLAITKTATPLGQGDALAISVHFDKKKVRVEAEDASGNINTDSIEAKPSRADVSFRVQGNYLIDFLQSSEESEITLGYLRDFHAFTFREPDRTVILMLIRDAAIPDNRKP